jgi:GT2 family glycosyltransferase
MPIATKRKTEARKAQPIIEPEAEPQPQLEEQPPTPKVTAPIFSYDSAPALRRCLAALEASNDRASIEILVVDCGSHDESPQLDSEFSEVTILRLPRYFGRTKALNIGTRTATGENLLYLSPEVEVLPTTVPALLARLESDAEAVAVAPLLLDTEARQAAQFYRLPTPKTGMELTPMEIDKSAEAVPVEYAPFQALMVRKYFVKGLNSGRTSSCAFRSDGRRARSWFCRKSRRSIQRVRHIPLPPRPSWPRIVYTARQCTSRNATGS